MRFSNVARLYDGEISLQRLSKAHFCVIGLGGVGSWVCEGLARSGVGAVTIIDCDDICVSNINRQMQALSSTVGQFKADALRYRMMDINPHIAVHVVYDFVRPANVEALLSGYLFDCIVDAADGVKDKAAIVDYCVRANIMCLVSGGAGGLKDPTLLRVSDLSRTEGCPLAMRVRKLLRQSYGYPRGHDNRVEKPWGVLTVHSLPTGSTRTLAPDSEDSDYMSCAVTDVSSTSSSSNSYGNSSSSCDSSSSADKVTGFRACDTRYGSASFATGSLGLALAGVAVSAVATGRYTLPRQALLLRRRLTTDGTKSSQTNSSKIRAECTCGGDALSGGAEKHMISNTAPTESVSSTTAASYGSGVSAAVPSGTLGDLFAVSNEALAVQYLSFGSKEGQSVSPLIDAHCHLQLAPLHTGTSQLLRAARRVGVARVVVCGTAPEEDWTFVAALAETYPDAVVPQFGVHPWRVAGLSAAPDWEAQLEVLLQTFTTAGVGECGLDKSRRREAPLDLQESILRKHLALARAHRRPVTLHCVGAWGRLLDLVTEHCSGGDEGETEGEVPGPAVVLHCCNSMSPELVPLFARLRRVFFSVTLRSLGEREATLCAAVPLNRLLVETDSPDQLPAELRDVFSCNQPALLKHGVERLARLLQMDCANLSATTYRNSVAAFELRE